MVIRQRMVVRCIETNEVFPSIQAAAKAKSLSASNLCSYLKYNMHGTRGGYHWEIIERLNMPKKIQCVETGRIFDSQTAAAKEYGCSRPSVGWSIKTGRPIYGHTFIEINNERD